jgi:NADPH2:quinone reductase
MKAMVMRALGDPSRLEAATLPDPEPGTNEIAIAVEVIGCNWADVLICQGKYQVKPELPFSPGSEVAGHVAALGPGVTGFKVGQRVAAQLSYGGYASYVCADVRRVQLVPDGVPLDDACGLGIAYQTAYLALADRARLSAGETLLVHAAAGGVGLATLQVGLALDANVIAGASGEKLELCLQHGAHAAVDTRASDWPAQVRALTDQHGADVIAESVGGDVFEGSLKCIAWAGRLVVVGFSSGTIPSAAMNRVMLKHISLIGLNLGGYHENDPKLLRSATEALYDLYQLGRLRPVISASYPLSRAPEALKELAERRSVGKLLLIP